MASPRFMLAVVVKRDDHRQEVKLWRCLGMMMMTAAVVAIMAVILDVLSNFLGSLLIAAERAWMALLCTLLLDPLLLNHVTSSITFTHSLAPQKHLRQWQTELVSRSRLPRALTLRSCRSIRSSFALTHDNNPHKHLVVQPRPRRLRRQPSSEGEGGITLISPPPSDSSLPVSLSFRQGQISFFVQ